jgi:hypothetical protein
MLKLGILDDYLDVSQECADWSANYKYFLFFSKVFASIECNKYAQVTSEVEV